MHNLNCGKKYECSPKMWATSEITKKNKINNHSLGENSPNFITLSPYFSACVYINSIKCYIHSCTVFISLHVLFLSRQMYLRLFYFPFDDIHMAMCG
jgi:hypothetical protein